jgi:hypothetical protein
MCIGGASWRAADSKDPDVAEEAHHQDEGGGGEGFPVAGERKALRGAQEWAQGVYHCISTPWVRSRGRGR